MVSKNNTKYSIEKNANKQQRFGLRKLSIGVASVLLGTTFFIGATTNVQADANVTNQVKSQSVELSNNSANPIPNKKAVLSSTPANLQSSTSASNSTPASSASSDGMKSAQSASSASPANANETQTLNTSDQTTAKAPASQLKANLAVTNPTTLTDNGQTEVTLTHGQQGNRNLAFNVVANANDTVTIKVPSIFEIASADEDSLHSVNVTVDKTNNNVIYFFTRTGSYNLNLTLKPTVSDWSFLADGSSYSVIVKKNGTKKTPLTYSIGAPAKITATTLKLDEHQKDNLVVGQKYAVGIQLNNDGSNDGDNFKGTVTINVPEGFQADTRGAYGLTGAMGSTDTVDSSDIELSQPGGAGTPVTINFNRGKADLNNEHILFWGTYTKKLASNENNFTASVTYRSAKGTNESISQTLSAQTFQINLPVNDAQRSELKPDMIMVDKVATDNGRANGEHQSQQTADWEYPSNYPNTDWKINIQNTGNIAQTNVKLHVNVEPGTVFNPQPDKSGGINFDTTGENSGITVVATLTDGSTITLLNHHDAGINSNGDNALLSNDAKAKDGSNIKTLDITFDKINAGSGVNITLNTVSSILSSATNKKAGDKAYYEYTISSDQGITTPNDNSKTIQIVDPILKKIGFSGVSKDFNDGTYDKNATGNESGSVYKSGQIAYTITHSKEDDSRPSSYLLVIPAGFHVADMKDMRIMHNGTDFKGATLTPLGKIGPVGEYVYRLDLPFTPGQNGVYVQKDNYKPIPLEINPDQGPASYNYVQHIAGNYSKNPNPVGIALLMEINNDGKLSDLNGFQVNDFKSIKLGNITYKVMPEDLGRHQYIDGNNIYCYSDARYTFLAPSMYGSQNGLSNEADGSSNFQYSDNQNGVENVNATKGRLTLSNILTSGGTSKYSYNVINLPSVDGQGVTLQLTGAGTISNDSNKNSELLYSLTPVNKTENLTAYDLKGFIPASQVTDWSKVRAVLLKSGELTNGSVINATVPFKVSAMNKDAGKKTVEVQNIFTGDHNGTSLNTSNPRTLNVQRYVQVTTEWVDGGKKPLGAVIQKIASGFPYETNPLVDEKIPKGYKLQAKPSNAKGTAGTSNITVTYVYVPDTQNATLNFVDDAAEGDEPKNPVTSINASGKSGSTILFKDSKGQTVDQIVSSLGNAGYKVKNVTNDSEKPSTINNFNDLNFGNYDTDDKTNQSFTIHLVHQTKTVNEIANATETIDYYYAGTTTRPKEAPQYTKTITYTRQGTEDLVAKNIIGWTSNEKFTSVGSPEIPGYTADKKIVDSPKIDTDKLGVKPLEVSFTVEYTANDQNATLNFVDDDAKDNKSKNPVASINASGKSGSTILFKDSKGQTVDQIISSLKNAGYKVNKVTNDSDNSTINNLNFGNYDTDDNNNQSFTIHLVHQTKTVNETANATETINYYYVGTTIRPQEAPQYTKTITYTRQRTKDLVTQKTSWGAWTSDQGFIPVDSPTVTGYTADTTTVAAPSVDLSKLVKQQTLSIAPITVYYTKNATNQTAILNFVDQDGNDKPIADSITAGGLSGTQIEFENVEKVISNLEQKHYVLRGMTKGTENVSKTMLLALLQAANEQITVSDQTKWNTIFGDFDEDDNTNQVFTLYFSHAHSSVASKSVTETIQYVGTGKQIDAHQSTLTFEPNDGSYHDEVTHDDHVTGWHVANTTNSTGTFVSVANPTITGYHVVSAVENGNDVLDHSTNSVKEQSGITETTKNIEITVTYAKDEPVDPTVPVSDTKSITETIHYVYSDGSKAHDDNVATLTFTRTGTKHTKTNTTDWNPWTPVSANFSKVKSPTIEGYTTDYPEIDSQKVTVDSADLVFTVTYTKNQSPVQPTTTPTEQPTVQPTVQPTSAPTEQPTTQPTVQPTSAPTEQPTVQPTVAPTEQPTTQPTEQSSAQPTTPQEPVQPTTPTQPAGREQPVQNETQTIQSSATPTPVVHPVHQQAEQLPQTGNEHHAFALVGLGLASLIGALGLSIRRKKDLK